MATPAACRDAMNPLCQQVQHQGEGSTVQALAFASDDRALPLVWTLSVAYIVDTCVNKATQHMAWSFV